MKCINKRLYKEKFYLKEMILLGENLTTLKNNSLDFEHIIEVATAAPAFPAFTSKIDLPLSDMELIIEKWPYLRLSILNREMRLLLFLMNLVAH